MRRQKKGNLCALLVEIENGVAAVENSIWFLKKLSIELPSDPAIPLLSIFPKELKAGSQRKICTPMFIAALLTTAKRWKPLKCPSINEWINKLWCIQTVEYYSPLKEKEILTPATTWMNLEDIMLSEISLS